jgi:hypothetical protein
MTWKEVTMTHRTPFLEELQSPTKGYHECTKLRIFVARVESIAHCKLARYSTAG